MKPNRRKLKLNRESIRTLTPDALRGVAGGTMLPSERWCDSEWCGTQWCVTDRCPDQTESCWCLPTW